MKPSPISDEALCALGERVASAWKLVAGRAPGHVAGTVAEALHGLDGLRRGAELSTAGRVELARQLEGLDAELRGRPGSPVTMYLDGRLGLVHVWEPVRIQETIDDRRVRAHISRYQSRVVRAERRLAWFLGRAGLDVGPPPDPLPWEEPYAAFRENREFIWGRITGALL